MVEGTMSVIVMQEGFSDGIEKSHYTRQKWHLAIIIVVLFRIPAVPTIANGTPKSVSILPSSCFVTKALHRT